MNIGKRKILPLIGVTVISKAINMGLTPKITILIHQTSIISTEIRLSFKLQIYTANKSKLLIR